jgi:hypothetical protein
MRFFAAVGDFGFIGIHVKPEDAVSEIDRLTDVYDSMKNMWSLQVQNHISSETYAFKVKFDKTKAHFCLSAQCS